VQELGGACRICAYKEVFVEYSGGNPTSDGTWTYTWEKGRQLKSMSRAGETATFTYNADGLRVKKVCTTTGTTNYTLHGKNLVHLSNGSNNLHFFYDAQNRPAVVVFNGAAYGYVHNLQGDIVAIVNNAGTRVVEYAYDAWGKPLSKTGSMASTLGILNPFRYRGYIYDDETQTFDLHDRYNSPVKGRFLNADQLVKNNLYAYCRNQPITRIDPSGHDSLVLTRDPADSSAKFPDETLPVDAFVDLIVQAVTTEDWEYKYGHSRWKETDCVGLAKYVLNWYYSYQSFKRFSRISSGKNKGKIFNQVKDLVKYGIQYGTTWAIEDPDYIPVGAAVFMYDPSNANVSRNNGWIHVGIYIGSWGDIEHAVAQAASADDGVGIWPLSDGFTHFGLFEGVDYR